MDNQNKSLAPRDKAGMLKSLLEKAKAEIAAALPRHLTPERMARIALTEARKNPELMNCEPASFLGAVIQAAQLGLEPGGALGHCYLIPFNNRKKGIKEVQFLIGYRGMLDLVSRSGKITHISARAVYDCDHFDFCYGLSERLEHKPGKRSEKSQLVAVYAIGFLKDSTRAVYDVMSIEEVYDIRARSKSSESGPWSTDFESMAKKSVIRRLFKYLPTSIECQKAIGLDEMADAGVAQDNASVIETEGKHVPENSASKLNSLLSQPASEQPPEPGTFDAFGKDEEEKSDVAAVS